jgi:hypothetical protein
VSGRYNLKSVKIIVLTNNPSHFEILNTMFLTFLTTKSDNFLNNITFNDPSVG